MIKPSVFPPGKNARYAISLPRVESQLAVHSQEGWRPAVIPPPDDRSSMAKAMDWASRIIAISFEMVAPVLGGHWVDGWLGSSPWFLLVGFALGVTLATLQLKRIVAVASQQAPLKKPYHVEHDDD